MRTILLAAAAVTLVAVGCGKDDKKNNGAASGPANPGLASVAPGFKNSAKDGKEVATRVDGVRTDLSQHPLSLTDAKPSTTSKLTLAKVSSFLGGGTLTGAQGLSAMPGEPAQDGGNDPTASLSLTPDSSCDDIANGLASYYQTSLDGLQTSADELRQWDDQTLPTGVTRLPADGRFAVGYQIDLKTLLQSAQQTSPQPQQQQLPSDGSTTITPSVSDFSGTVTFGAGASDHEVGLEVDAAVSAKADTSTFALQSGFAAYADQTARQVKVNANLAVSAQSSDGNGNVKGSFQSVLDAGAQPSLAVAVDAQYAATQNSQTEQDAVKASVSLKKVSANALVYEWSATDKDGTKSGKVELVTDASGTCVVKTATPAN